MKGFCFERRAVLILWLVFSPACASLNYPKISTTDEDFRGKPDHVQNVVPFVEQAPNLCGPTALLMVSQPLRPELTLDQIRDLTFTPAAAGSYPQDMLSATRRLHLAPYSVKSVTEILSALAYGSPVVIFHRTGFLWKDLWHYSVLTGYDRLKEELIMHIGPYENRHVDWSQVVGSWTEGGKWAFIVEPPRKLPEFARFEDALANDFAFLRLGYIQEAYALSSEMIARWPNRYEPDVVMAQIFSEINQPREALRSLKRAHQKQPENVALKNEILKYSRAYQ